MYIYIIINNNLFIDNEVGDEGIRLLSNYLSLMKNNVGGHIRVNLSGMKMTNVGLRYIGENLNQIVDVDELSFDLNDVDDIGLIEFSQYCRVLLNLIKLNFECILYYISIIYVIVNNLSMKGNSILKSVNDEGRLAELYSFLERSYRTYEY